VFFSFLRFVVVVVVVVVVLLRPLASRAACLVATEFLDASVALDELGFEVGDSLLLLLVLSSEFLLVLGSFVFLNDWLELLGGLGGGDEAWGEVDGLGVRGLSVEPLVGRQSGLVGGGWWVEIVLEDVGLKKREFLINCFDWEMLLSLNEN